MGALRLFFVLLILCLCIPVVETVNTSSTDIEKEKEVVLGEVMESAALQFDNNYKTDDSKWQTSHTSNITFMVQKEMKDVPVYTDGELEVTDDQDDQESSTFLVSYLKYSIISVLFSLI